MVMDRAAAFDVCLAAHFANGDLRLLAEQSHVDSFLVSFRGGGHGHCQGGGYIDLASRGLMDEHARREVAEGVGRAPRDALICSLAWTAEPGVQLGGSVHLGEHLVDKEVGEQEDTPS